MTKRVPHPLGIDAAKKPAHVGHGGARKGAGRPPSKATTRSKAIADAIAAGERVIEEAGEELPADATPLDVMMLAMRAAYKIGSAKGPGQGAIAAFPYAEKAAPYIHARIAQMQLIPPRSDNGQITFTWAGELKKNDDVVDVEAKD